MIMIVKILMTMAVWGSTALGQQQPTVSSATNPLGTRYSASTDVSHISFTSPLVTYGAALNEVQLPAAPIQPANLKQLPPNLVGVNPDIGEIPTKAPTELRNEASLAVQDRLQRLQVGTNADQQQQYISVQQFPANPQLQNNDQQLQRYAQQQLPLPQTQQQYLVTQPQHLSQRQQYPLMQQYLHQQQHPVLQPQQQHIAHHSPVEHLQRLQSHATGGYFATGPYAAQYPQPGTLLARQLVPQPLLPQVSPAAQIISRVAFNGPTAGFSYSF